MTDAGEKALGKRVSTRTTRTSSSSQERKEAGDTTAVEVVAAETEVTSGSDAKGGDLRSPPASETSTGDDTATTTDVANDAAGGRRSTRRAAAGPTPAQAKSKQQSPQPLSSDSHVTNVENTATTTTAVGDTKTPAASGAELAAELDASDSGTDSDEDSVKRKATKRAKTQEEQGTKEDVAETTTHTKPDLQTSVQVSSSDVAMESAVPVGLDASTVTPDLKRGSAVLTDMSADGISGDPALPKAKRVRKTREEKLAILAFVDDGGTHVAAAEKFGVSRTAVTKMVKERDIIESGIGLKHAANSATTAPPTGVSPASAPVVHTSAAQPVPSLSVDTSAIGATRKSTRAAAAAVSTPPARVATPSGGGSGSSTPTTATAATGATNAKARRVRKTNEEKLLILEFVERGGSQGAAAEKFGVSRTAVTKMVKEKEAITAQVMSGKSNHRKVLQYQHKLSIIEDMLYKWQVQVENDAPNLKITGDLLQSKAVEFRDKILSDWKGSLEPEVVQSLSDFKASNGWLHRYLQRRNLRTASKREYQRRPGATTADALVSGIDDSSSVNGSTLPSLANDFSHQLKSVPVQCIWNLDEIALLPNTLTNGSAEGEEASSPADRVTVTLMVNAAGEKFKPQVVIRETEIAKLEALQKAYPGLVLTAQHPQAVQDTTTLALYLNAVNIEAKSRMETWFVLMDASPSHTDFVHLVDPTGSFERGYRFENLVLFLLPAQPVSELHPIHQGVSRVFKAAYRQALLDFVLSSWRSWKQESGNPKPFPLPKELQMSDATQLITHAWNSVPPALIRHCWVRQGLLVSSQLAQISQDNSRAIEAELFNSLTESITMISEVDNGSLARDIGLIRPPSATSATGATEQVDVAASVIDQVNALITLDDLEPTERKVLEISGGATNGSHVITETDGNGDLRALV